MFFQTKSKSAEFAGIILHQREFCGSCVCASSSNRLVDSVQAAIPRGALRGGVCVLCGVCRSVYGCTRGRQGVRVEGQDHGGCAWTARADDLDVWVRASGCFPKSRPTQSVGVGASHRRWTDLFSCVIVPTRIFANQSFRISRDTRSYMTSRRTRSA